MPPLSFGRFSTWNSSSSRPYCAITKPYARTDASGPSPVVHPCICSLAFKFKLNRCCTDEDIHIKQSLNANLSCVSMTTTNRSMRRSPYRSVSCCSTWISLPAHARCESGSPDNGLSTHDVRIGCNLLKKLLICHRIAFAETFAIYSVTHKPYAKKCTRQCLDLPSISYCKGLGIGSDNQYHSRIFWISSPHLSHPRPQRFKVCMLPVHALLWPISPA